MLLPLTAWAKAAVAVALPLLLGSGPLLPSREAQSASVSMTDAITKFRSLPQEELITQYSLANTYLMEGQFQDALTSIDIAAEIRADLPDVWLTRGIVNEKLLHFDDAVSDYMKARDLSKQRDWLKREDPIIISNLANAETGLGNWQDALRDFTKSSDIDKTIMAPKIGKSLVLYQLDRKQEAMDIMKQILDQYPQTFTDGQAAVAVMGYDISGGDIPSLERGKVMWREVVSTDPRYEDMDWLLNIRRWPPKLVAATEVFRKAIE